MEIKDLMAIIAAILYLTPIILIFEMIIKDVFLENVKFGLCTIVFFITIFLRLSIVLLFLITLPIKPLNKKIRELDELLPTI